VRPRPPHRDLIVRLDGHVRFARLIDGAVADALWERMPIYGAVARTAAGSLELATEVMLAVAEPIPGQAPQTRNIYYAPTSGRVVFSASAEGVATGVLFAWAELVEPFPRAVLAAVADGARGSLLHADS
jgi:hypothetical protein